MKMGVHCMELNVILQDTGRMNNGIISMRRLTVSS